MAQSAGRVRELPLVGSRRAPAPGYAGRVANEKRPQTVLGEIIRKQRELAALPMRQMAAAVGISNPYLSQIERGLRAPSDAVLAAIADSLETTTGELYAAAGFIDRPQTSGQDEPPGLVAEIEEAAELTPAQRKALLEVYRAFVDANSVRHARRSTGT